MPRNTTINVPANTWTELTSANVTALTFQTSDSHLRVKGTIGAVAPTDSLGAILYGGFSGERNTPVIDLWPGLTGVNRVWAYSQTPTGVMVSHA